MTNLSKPVLIINDRGTEPSDDNDTAKRLPLGTQVSSLRACPESGIYQCASDAPGITEHRRLIEAGRPMPYGVAQRTAKRLGGLLGTQEEDAVDITWTLIAYMKDKL